MELVLDTVSSLKSSKFNLLSRGLDDILLFQLPIYNDLRTIVTKSCFY